MFAIPRIYALTKEATIGGTRRTVKYSVCAKIAMMILRPPKAPMKPYRHTIHDGEGGNGFPRKPSQRLSHSGRRASPLWIWRSTGMNGS
jgi:hypothetical protein